MRAAGRAAAASGVLLAAAGLAALLFLARPEAFGLSALEVATPSMSPGIPVGSAVYIREGSYGTGDVVAYRDGSGREILHRIVGGDAGSGFILKGDANERADRLPVMPGSISGKAVLAVRDGRLLRECLAVSGALLACMGAALFLAGSAMSGRKPEKGDRT